MHSAYSAGWWSSTAGVQMGPEFGITVRMWSDLHTFAISVYSGIIHIVVEARAFARAVSST